MAIFLDTGKIELIEKYHAMGIIRGVTTNPTIMVRDGIRGGLEGIKRQSIKISQIIHPYPLSVEVTNNNPEEMAKQALEFSRWAENINVKITIHGPNGELDNLRIIHELETQHNIRINATAAMSAQQCFLAALAGATYVSIFGGRANDMGNDSCTEISRLRNLLEEFDLKSNIIVGSTREIINIIEWLEAGAHIVTVPPKLIDQMIIHPYTKETVQMFLKDGAKFEKSK